MSHIPIHDMANENELVQMSQKMGGKTKVIQCQCSQQMQISFLIVMYVGQKLKTSLGSSFPVHSLIMSHTSGQTN